MTIISGLDTFFRVTAFTQRLNVFNHIGAAVKKRYDVVCCKGNVCLSATKTLVTVLITKINPLFRCKSSPASAFFCPPNTARVSANFWMFCVVFLHLLFSSIFVFFVPLMSVLNNLLFVGFVVLTIHTAFFIWISKSPLFVFLVDFLFVASVIKATIKAFSFDVSLLSFMYSFILARFTPAIMPTKKFFVFRKLAQQFHEFTFSTNFGFHALILSH